MANELRIYEIIELVSETKTRDAKCEVLNNHKCAALTDILRCAFDDTIQFSIPDGTPPYTAAEEDSVKSDLRKENVNLTYFVKGGRGDAMPGYKREEAFINVLESIHPKDAEILLLVKDKKTPGKSITKKLVEKAFPGLIKK